jgi:hypothetical protein
MHLKGAERSGSYILARKVGERYCGGHQAMAIKSIGAASRARCCAVISSARNGKTVHLLAFYERHIWIKYRVLGARHESKNACSSTKWVEALTPGTLVSKDVFRIQQLIPR